MADPMRERERKYYTYPTTQGCFRCCQDISWQIPKNETVCINTKNDIIERDALLAAPRAVPAPSRWQPLLGSAARTSLP